MGSLRSDGNTAHLAKYFMERMGELEAEVEYVELRNKKIYPCVGCKCCQDRRGEYGCPQEDDVAEIVDSMLKSDVLVFATPIYTWQATPPTKALMDRMYGLNKYYGKAPREVLNVGQAYALLTSCGYDPDRGGADLLDEVMRRWCKHSGTQYKGMYAFRDKGDPQAFSSAKAQAGARDFADEIIRTCSR
jgi:multimeric flavodoxin WrbA